MSPARSASGTPSKPVIVSCVGHREPLLRGVPQRAEGEHVGGADDGRDLGVRREQLRRGLLARLDAVVEALHHRHVGPVDADLGEAVAQTREPVALHRVGGVLLARAVGGPVVAPGAQPHAEHPDRAGGPAR